MGAQSCTAEGNSSPVLKERRTLEAWSAQCRRGRETPVHKRRCACASTVHSRVPCPPLATPQCVAEGEMPLVDHGVKLCAALLTQQSARFLFSVYLIIPKRLSLFVCLFHHALAHLHACVLFVCFTTVISMLLKPKLWHTLRHIFRRHATSFHSRPFHHLLQWTSACVYIYIYIHILLLLLLSLLL